MRGGVTSVECALCVSIRVLMQSGCSKVSYDQKKEDDSETFSV